MLFLIKLVFFLFVKNNFLIAFFCFPFVLHQADVIVNTASKELNLTQGAVSNSIQQVAGPNLQTECKTKAPNGLKAGDMITTAGHNLQCKHVYHVVCDSWDGGKGGAEMVSIQ